MTRVTYLQRQLAALIGSVVVGSALQILLFTQGHYFQGRQADSRCPIWIPVYASRAVAQEPEARHDCTRAGRRFRPHHLPSEALLATPGSDQGALRVNRRVFGNNLGVMSELATSRRLAVESLL